MLSWTCGQGWECRSRGDAASLLGQGHWAGTGLSWDTLQCGSEHRSHTAGLKRKRSPKAVGDGFRGRDDLEVEKVLVQRASVSPSLLGHTFLRSSSSSRWQANAGRSRNVAKDYSFSLVYEETEVGRGEADCPRLLLTHSRAGRDHRSSLSHRFSCYFTGNFTVDWKPSEILNFKEAVLPCVKMLVRA